MAHCDFLPSVSVCIFPRTCLGMGVLGPACERCILDLQLSFLVLAATWSLGNLSRYSAICNGSLWICLDSSCAASHLSLSKPLPYVGLFSKGGYIYGHRRRFHFLVVAVYLAFSVGYGSLHIRNNPPNLSTSSHKNIDEPKRLRTILLEYTVSSQ